MVCGKCEKKLRKGGPAPDPWKEGSNNELRRPGTNKLLSAKKWQPSASKCKTCKSTLHEPDAQYCQSCAYIKGICHMCGSQILDTASYKQSST